MGNNVFRYFLEWLKLEIAPKHYMEWLDHHIHAYYAVGVLSFPPSHAIVYLFVCPMHLFYTRRFKQV